MPFTFAGTTIVAPGILVRTIIGAQKALALLPFGTICFIGASDGTLLVGVFVMLLVNIVLIWLSWYLIATGYKLKA